MLAVNPAVGVQERMCLKPSHQTRPRKPGPIAVKHRGRVVLVDLDDVDWVESAANYSVLHVRSDQYMVRATMNQMLGALGPEAFARIHRGTIVRVRQIEHLQPQGHGDFLVVLRDGTVLKLSRRYKAAFFATSTHTLRRLGVRVAPAASRWSQSP